MTNIAGTRPQLDEKLAKFVPGQPDMWMFVLFESLLFTGYHSVYLVSRTQNEDLYLQSQADLDLGIGVFNTIALLLSSWAIARCVQASRNGAYRSALINAFLTISFGLVFLTSKVLEWVKEIHMGNTFTGNEFFQQTRLNLVTWRSFGLTSATIDLDASSNGGGTWIPIVTATPNEM